MAIKHGTRRGYVEGCRCDDCAEADRVYKREYRWRKANGEPVRQVSSDNVRALRQSAIPVVAEPKVGPGAVEAGVVTEITGLAQTEARPGLAQAALALARILDNPRAVNQQAAAASKLADILDTLRKGADTRKSRLASVRQMTNARSVTG